MKEETKQKVIVFSPIYNSQETTTHFSKTIRKWFKADGRYEVASVIADGNLDTDKIFSFMLLSEYIDKFKIADSK